jgi:pilus assembly protein CpaE
MSKAPASENQGNYGAASHERPVPRISIDAFCEFPDTQASLERAATDRRLSKAHVNVQPGGVQGAVTHYGTQPTPNLLVVETRCQGDDVIAELEQLATVCDESTKVIVVGRVNDVQLYRELTRRGVSEYMVAPLDPLHFIETISGLYAGPKASPIGRVTVFTGARGGIGSSTLAHNTAWFVAEELKIDTAIIDFDLAFGTLGLNFNEDSGQGIADALAAPERLDDVLLDRLLIKYGPHLSLFPAPALLDRDYDVDDGAYETVVDQVRNSIPCVVVDLPHVWAPWSRQTLLAADEIVIVAALDLVSLRNAKSILDVVRARRPHDGAPRLVINQAGIPKRPEIPLKEFAAAIGQEPELVLPFDPQLFGSAANNGQMLAEVAPAAAATDGVRKLAGAITGRKISRSSKKGSFLPFIRKAG